MLRCFCHCYKHFVSRIGRRPVAAKYSVLICHSSLNKTWRLDILVSISSLRKASRLKFYHAKQACHLYSKLSFSQRLQRLVIN